MNTVSRGVAHGFHRGQPRCGSAVGNVLRPDLHVDGSVKAMSHCRFSLVVVVEVVVAVSVAVILEVAVVVVVSVYTVKCLACLRILS